MFELTPLQKSYLKNKHRGGESSSRGNRYEDFFATYKIACLLNEYLSQNKDLESVDLSSQVIQFVDDLFINYSYIKKHEFFQIKDVKSLFWNSGDHPLEEDFFLQKRLEIKNGIAFDLYLVVSRKDVYESMKANIPQKIMDKIDVLYFPNEKSLSKQIYNNNELYQQYSSLSGFSSPHMDEVVSIATTILGIWCASDQEKITLNNIYKLFLKKSVNIKSRIEITIPEIIAETFNRISGLKYKMEGEALSWQFENDSGVIYKDKFDIFVEELLKVEPESFEELEILITRVL